MGSVVEKEEALQPPNARVQLQPREAGAMDAVGALRAIVSCNDSLDAGRLRMFGRYLIEGRTRHARSRAQAGTQVSRIASSPTRSLPRMRSGGRAPAKYGLPPPRTNGRK